MSSPVEGYFDCIILLLVHFKVWQELKNEGKNNVEDGNYRS